MLSEEDVRALALAMPQAEEHDHHGFPSFRIRGKIFCTVRGDPPRLMVKLGSEDQHNFCEANPGVIAPVPGYWGRKGSTYVDFSLIDRTLAQTLLTLAWNGAAPKPRRGAVRG